MVQTGIDCATKLTASTAAALKKAGYAYVMRYLGTNWKTMNADEAKAISDAGLKLVSIYETNPTKASYFTKSQGVADAKEATRYAKKLGQPSGTAIYFAVDYDAQPSHMAAIKDYFSGIVSALDDAYNVGVYGSYAVVNALKGKVGYFWQTYAWSGGKLADHVHMYQHQNDVTICGINADKNKIYKDPGAWTTKKPASKPASEPKPASDKYQVKKTVNGYLTAADAKARKNARGKVSAGSYYIFNQSQGMINVTSKEGVPGSWINPADNTAASKTASKPPAQKINGIPVLGHIQIVNVANAAYICDRPSSTSSKNLATAKKGSTWPIAGSVPGWYEIIWNGRRAYINQKFAKRV